MDGGGGLAAVDDLQVLDAGQGEAAGWKIDQADIGGGGRDPVVVGQKPVGPVEDGLSDALVDGTSRLQEGADVAFQQAGAVQTCSSSATCAGPR
jgi:hypothetical protein